MISKKKSKKNNLERMGSPSQVLLFSVQNEIKTGFIFLQSCDGCSSHAKIISIAQQIILETSKVLETMQPGPPMPPQPEDYVGVYTNKYGVSYLSWFPLLLLPPIFGLYAVQWNPSVMDTFGEQHFVRYSKVSPTQGLPVYFR